MTRLHKAKLVAFETYDDKLDQTLWVKHWLEKWADIVTVAEHSADEYMQTWKVFAPNEAIREIPAEIGGLSNWKAPSIFRSSAPQKTIKGPRKRR